MAFPQPTTTSTPSTTPSQADEHAFTPLVCIVDFHHARGPEIEAWIGCPEGSDPAAENDWGLIPYMALPDGAHQSEEEFSYFSLVHKASKPTSGAAGRPGDAGEADKSGDNDDHGGDAGGNGSAGVDKRNRKGATSVFGISCMHQIPSADLLWKSEDVTRSAVQKAVVAITDRPMGFAALREKLSVVTRAWFAQRDFREREILQRFQENLVRERAAPEDEQVQFGLGLREMLYRFKWQTLVLFKCLLLQPKMLFFGSNCERVCQIQFSLISLIPGLVQNLGDCADPALDNYAASVRPADSVRTSDRASLLAYLGVPLQLFGKGSVFGPYTPLQQLDTLTDQDTKSYVVGSTNNLLIQNRDRYCDCLIDMDDNSVHISSPSLKAATALSTADRRWIDFITQSVVDTWDETDPSRPKTHGYAGSEEFIRLQFDEYLLAFLSATKYRQYLDTQKAGDAKALLSDVEGDPSTEFSQPFLDAWRETENYKLWNRITDSHLFDIIEPRHPCAGGLTIEDVQRRLASQVAEMHLDERFSQTREVVNKRLTDGRTQVATAFNKVWADIEVMREAQRKRAEEARANAPATTTSEDTTAAQQPTLGRIGKPDLTQAQASVAAAGQKASAYFSSWGAWASEKRKTGWRASSGNEEKAAQDPSTVGDIAAADVKYEITQPETAAWGNETVPSGAAVAAAQERLSAGEQAPAESETAPVEVMKSTEAKKSEDAGFEKTETS